MLLSVQQKVIAGFGFASALLIIASVAAYNSANRLTEASAKELHTKVVLVKLEEVLSELKDAETGQRGYLLTGEDIYLTPYYTALPKLNKEIQELRKLTSDNPNQQQQVNNLKPLIDQKLAEIQQTITLRKNRGFNAALQVVRTNEGKQLMDKIRKRIDLMKVEEDRLLKIRNLASQQSAASTLTIIAITILLNFSILSLVYYLIYREMKSRQAAENEILRLNAELEQRVEERTAALKNSNQALEKHAQMLDLATDSIIIRDIDDKISYWNQGAEQFYGFKKDFVQGQYIHTFLQTVFPEPFPQIKAKFLQQGRWEGELIHTKKDGTLVTVASRWTLQFDENGSPTSFLEINNDITSRKLAEQALTESEAKFRQQAQELEKLLQELRRTQSQLLQSEKMSSLGQLVAGVAHEINNPVNFIYGNLVHAQEYTNSLLSLIKLYQYEYPRPTPKVNEAIEEIELDFLSEDLPKLLSSMKVGAVRIREIVQSLRNFSRLDEAEMKEVDLHEGLESTLMILANRLKAKLVQVTGKSQQLVEIQVIKEYSNLPKVECLAGQMNQVFLNILTNAIDALEEGIRKDLVESPKIWIITKYIDDGKMVRIEISDNGPGMTEDTRSRLFDPFFTTKTVGVGTGLGMSISYQIVVEKHGGNLECISSPGEGAKFFIELPIHPHPQAKVANI
ncbi:CHASE3 domain-containing protein [Phormidium sp. LEGE 05292]|uniref:CHASE3 domain-containing protein n=1 Tax=[Phormidium] sp. LEGE 05292 TaxID=767427 RepID=UPI00187E4446|nr:CHASE3 domain-containing protein [Phormidium sp. LEGE 05292]MBE9225167.1 CHASE3 domain-containing protein [Phormidium sp. LEGE 05292]